MVVRDWYVVLQSTHVFAHAWPFMQTDPVGPFSCVGADGMNWYAYFGNDPVNKTDPLGLMGDEIEVIGKRQEEIDAGRAQLDAGLSILSIRFDVRDIENNTILVSARTPSRPEVYGPLQYGPQNDESECSTFQNVAGNLAWLSQQVGTIAGTASDVAYVGGLVTGGGTVPWAVAIDGVATGADFLSLGLDWAAGNNETLQSRKGQVALQLLPSATLARQIGKHGAAIAADIMGSTSATSQAFNHPARTCGNVPFSL